jgi:asparagine synthase (glutamine-hydrolysing)
MCGITGIVQQGSVPDRGLIERMTATLVHRGPDAEGFHIGPDVGLGFRRLAIIDLATGDQPVSNETKTVLVVFNGEIYNYRELRRTLLEAGHEFRSEGDSEVLAHLYEERGMDMVHDLRGMFAFALWDAEKRELLLARDRAGEKPLYFTDGIPGGGFGFASEMKALLAAGVNTDPNFDALAEYLFHLYIPAPRTAFACISKLPPGHFLRYRDREMHIERYWEPRFAPVDRTEAEHVDGLREHVFDAVHSRLVADVPIGAFLSGGIDSSSVVAAMRATHDQPVHTFTITFEGHEHYDESEAARATARHFGTDHHELRARLDGPELLPEIVDSFDEPFGNATAALVKALSAATSEHVKVVLTGDGADELFFGYPRYRGLQLADRYRRLTPRALRRVLARMSDLIPESTEGWHTARRAREFLGTGGMTSADAYVQWIGYFTEGQLETLLTPELEARANQASRFIRRLLGESPHPGLNEVSRAELQSFLPFNVLEYADKMSMAHSLELRAPFVDHKLVDYVGTMPAELKLRRGQSKWALRQALRQDLPTDVLRRPKRGLNPPLGAWLSDGAAPLVDDCLNPSAVRQRGLLRPEAVSALIREQKSGWRDRSLHIWALLVLELWFRQRVDT